ncbi:hypothetical protein HY468_00470 [Candidatus Roizmanbacteria bacterium]|nr:hypothetical protein [Candidatus Roizmanbacteria bacterium]
MPKKTKKRKIIAEYRRKLLTLGNIQPPVVSSRPRVSIREKSEVKSEVKPQIITPKTAFSGYSLQHVRRDLIKTFVLSLLAVTLEFVLYLVTKS